MRRGAILLVLSALLAAAGGAWYWASPRLALSRLADGPANPEALAGLYDRGSLRAGFVAQTTPAMADYPPPLTRDVILDALVDPRSVRLLVAEPYGAWQFAAAEGVPEALLEEAGLADESPMPRMLERAESWEFERDGIDGFTARPADREGGHVYRFERDGLGWTLKHIELSEPIR